MVWGLPMKVDTHKTKADEEQDYQAKVARVKRNRALLLGGGLLLVVALLGYTLSDSFHFGSSVPVRELTQTEQRLMRLAVLHREYGGATGKAPSTLDELRDWVKRLGRQKQAAYGVEEVETLFVSERDQQPFVLDRPPRGIGPILAHERTGAGGKRFVVSSVGSVTEVDEAGFEQMKETMRALAKPANRPRYGGR